MSCGEGSTRIGFGSCPTLSPKLWTISGHVLKYPCRRGSGIRFKHEGRHGEPLLDHCRGPVRHRCTSCSEGRAP
jgi:hypothetical protein